MTEGVLAGYGAAWRVWQRGGARPVLALHCSLAHSGAWARLAENLQGVTVTALDQPGHGRSAPWDPAVPIHDQAVQMAGALAETLAIAGPIDVVGHSFGGTVALRLAELRPDLLRSLVLIEPVLFAAAKAVGDPAFAPFLARHQGFAKLVLAGEVRRAATVFHADWGGDEAFGDLPERQQSYILDRIGLIVSQNPALLDDAAGLLAPERLERLTMPVLLIEGANSPPVVAAVQRALAARLPNVLRRSVAGAGHMLPISHPKQVAALMQAHLDSG